MGLGQYLTASHPSLPTKNTQNVAFLEGRKWLLDRMIKFNRVGILKLSIMEKELPALFFLLFFFLLLLPAPSCKRVFEEELLKLFVDIFQELNGITVIPYTPESEGQKCHSLT